MNPRLLTLIALRAVQSALVVIVVVSVVFFLSRLTGDPVRVLLPPDAPQEEIERIRREEGLTRPLYVQYALFWRKALTLDFGYSFRTRQPAVEEVKGRLPATIKLGLAAVLYSLLVGVPLGVLAAVKRGTPLDLLARLLALVGQTTPNFWLGLMLILLFAVRLGWLPTGGEGGPRHLILPAVTLGSFNCAVLLRLTRSAMLEVLGSDFVRTARAKGLAELLVIGRHALPNALIPVVTVLGLQVGVLVAGSIIVETVFSWPGMGRLVIQAIAVADYPVLQVGVIFIATVIVLANWAVDISYLFLDPRIRAAA
jgi:peptide/nickel transport system permease protein